MLTSRLIVKSPALAFPARCPWWGADILSVHETIQQKVLDSHLLSSTRTHPSPPPTKMTSKVAPRHPTWTLSFSERAQLPNTTPLATYLLHLIAIKKSNLCLSADVSTTAQLVKLAEDTGDSICLLKTHADIITDWSDRTVRQLREIAKAKGFLIFEDRKFGDIGSTYYPHPLVALPLKTLLQVLSNANIPPGLLVLSSGLRLSTPTSSPALPSSQLSSRPPKMPSLPTTAAYIRKSASVHLHRTQPTPTMISSLSLPSPQTSRHQDTIAREVVIAAATVEAASKQKKLCWMNPTRIHVKQVSSPSLPRSRLELSQSPHNRLLCSTS